jgi:hypothetical protein
VYSGAAPPKVKTTCTRTDTKHLTKSENPLLVDIQDIKKLTTTEEIAVLTFVGFKVVCVVSI